MPEIKKYSNFRSKVLNVLVLTGVIPLLIISVISLVTVVKTRLENISELQSEVIEGTSEKIERYLDQKINVFNLVIDLNPENISGVKKESLEFIAQGLKEAAGDVNEITFVEKYGKEIVKISDIQGLTPAPLKNIKERESFKKAISGENYFGPVYYTLLGPVMHLASQIENKDRNIIGVIVAEISLNPLEREASQVKIGREGFVYLIDEYGSLIFSSNKDFARQGEDLSYVPQIKDVVDGNSHNGLAKEDRYTNPLNQKVIFSGNRLERVKWSVISEWPWKDAFLVVEVMIEGFLWIMLITLLLIVGSSLIFARLVVRPIEALSKGADEISKGNLDYKIDIGTGDELEKLGERFNNMIKILKENEELRDQFFFIATHELRAPVTVTKAYLAMILEGEYGKLNKKMRKVLETSQNLNERLVKLVHDLLEVARSEAGKIEIEVEPIMAVKVIKEIVQEYKEPAAKKDIKLVYQEPEKEIEIMADSYRLKEVLTNLIDNALKYTLKKGKIEITHEIKDKNFITHVKDQGMGISKKDMENLFTRFYRVKNEKTKGIVGTGLGLFICKEIIQRMNGKIWAESELGKGSTFSFSLPLA